MKKIFIVFGTRPEYLKIKPLVSCFLKHSISFLLIQIVQHEDLEVEEKNEPYFRKLHLMKYDNHSRLISLASSIPIAIEPLLIEANSVFVQGDTATAFYTALTAFQLQVPVYHIEAGLRTYDLANPFPEEAYRSMISRIATYHLCPDEESKQNLLKENIHKNLFVVGNTILDLVKSYNKESRLGTLVPITIHRRENWSQMKDIVKTILYIAKENPTLHFLWIYHPNPSLQKEIQETLLEVGTPSNFQCIQPCSHETLCSYLHGSYCVITDSGGIQEEASFLGKFSFVIRKQTERSSIPKTYIQLIETISDLPSIFRQKEVKLLPPCTVYGEGDACEKIARIIT